jgi:hypothetical protein
MLLKFPFLSRYFGGPHKKIILLLPISLLYAATACADTNSTSQNAPTNLRDLFDSCLPLGSKNTEECNSLLPKIKEAYERCRHISRSSRDENHECNNLPVGTTGPSEVKTICAKGDKQRIEKWANSVSNIMTGKVLEARLRMNKKDAYEDSCWVRFSINKSIKGSADSEIWLKVAYNKWSKDGWKDIYDLKNCPLKAGKKYLVFAQNYTPYNKDLPDYLGVGYDENNYNCTPITLPEAGTTIKILNKLFPERSR